MGVVTGDPVGFWDVALCALGLMLVIEGLLPMLDPPAWKRVFERAVQLRDGQLRFLGVGSVVSGLAMLLLFWP